MGIVSTSTFTSTTEQVTKDKLNNLVANLLTEFNGNIENVNIADSTIDLTTKVTGILPATNATVSIGTVNASQIVAVDSDKDITGFRNITTDANGSVVVGSGGTIGIDTTILSETEIGVIDGVTAGTSTANKSLVIDGSKQIDEIDPTTLKIGGTTVSSTADEINKLDGASVNVTSTNLNTLTAGVSSNSDSLHTHTGLQNGGYVFLAEFNASSSSSVDIVSVIDSTYDEYKIVISDLDTNISDLYLFLQASRDNGSTWLDDEYQFVASIIRSGSTTVSFLSQASVSGIQIAGAIENDGTSALSGEVNLYNSDIMPSIIFETAFRNENSNEISLSKGSGRVTTSGSINAIQFFAYEVGTFPDPGIIVSGKFKIYGLINS